MAKNNKVSRFIEIYSQKNPGINKVLVDMATGVNYYFHSEPDGYSSSGGLVVLRNPDGSPVVTPPEMFMPPL